MAEHEDVHEGQGGDDQAGYLDEVEGQADPSASASAIAPGDELWQRNQRLNGITRNLDVVRLTEQERAQIGEPLSAQEKTLSAGVADFIAQFGTQLRKIGLNPDRMGQAFDVDVGLEQCEQASSQVEGGTRDGVFLLSGAMTASAGVAEQAAADIKGDPATSESERRNIETAFGPLVNLREQALKSAGQRQARGTRQRTQRTAELSAAQDRQITTVVTNQMASAALPGISPLPGKATGSKHHKTAAGAPGKTRKKGRTGGTQPQPARGNATEPAAKKEKR